MNPAILAVLAIDSALWALGLTLNATATLVVVGFVLLAIVQAWRVAARVGGER